MRRQPSALILPGILSVVPGLPQHNPRCRWMNEVSVAGALQVHDAVYLEKRVDLFLNAMFIFLVSDPRLHTSPCRSVGRFVTFLNSGRFSHYCSCPTVRDCLAVYPALFSGYFDKVVQSMIAKMSDVTVTPSPLKKKGFFLFRKSSDDMI